MATVRGARLSDEEPIVALLADVLGGRPHVYRSIFAFARSRIGLDAGDAERPLGAVLERADGSVAGFLGLLASRQRVHSDDWVLHMTSWAVAMDVRSQGLKLLYHIRRAHKGILLNFSGTDAVQAILPRFGFKPVDDAQLMFSTLSLSGGWHRLSRSISTGRGAAELITDVEQRGIVLGHLMAGCRALAVDRDGRRITAVLARLGQDRAATAYLMHLYPTDPDAVAAIWPALVGFVAIDMRCPQLRVDRRHAPANVRPQSEKPRQMFACNFAGRARDLTRAYGEPLNAWSALAVPRQ
jgi:hypothetical protein